MKKILMLCILIAGVLFLAGCSSSKENVNLLSEKEVIKYAKEKFGKATLKKTKSKTEDEVTYIVTDKKYKFDYEITSYIERFCLDGSCGDIYYERTISDFSKVYYDYIISSSEDKVDMIEQKYNVEIKNDDGWNSVESNYRIKDCSTQAAFYSVYGDNPSERRSAANELADYVKKVDNRKFFSKCSIWIRGNEKNSNGKYPRIDSILLEQ